MLEKLASFSLIFFLVLSLSLFEFSEAQEEATLDPGVELVLNISPETVREGENTHPIGFVHLVHEEGGPVISTKDYKINLESSNLELVSVPQFVYIEQGEQYAKFDVSTGNSIGSVTIIASIGDFEVEQEFKVGETAFEVEGKDLKINFPIEEMHSNSMMPISVVMVNEDGDVLQSPEDFVITLEYSKELVSTNNPEIIISKGDFYAETILMSTKEVGTAFIKASIDELGISVIDNIKVTSTAPKSLQMDIFPPKLGFTEDRFNIVVSVLDTDGLATIATSDIHLELFSDDVAISESLTEDIPDFGPLAAIIKKGEFSWSTQIEFQFQEGQKTALVTDEEEDEEEEEVVEGILIGVSSPDLGIATNLLEIVDPVNPDDVAPEDELIEIFTLETIPRGVDSIFVYQLSSEVAVEEEEEDEDEEATRNPMQSNTNFSPLVSEIAASQKFSLVSDDNDIVAFDSIAPVLGGDSFGTARIISKEQIGTVTLATTFEGIGTATTDVEVIDTLSPVSSILFTLSGGDKVLFDKDGIADLYIMLIDQGGRPTESNKDVEFIITPENEFITIPAFTPFVKTALSLSSIPELVNNRTNIEIIPVGVEVGEGLELINSMEVQPIISQVQLMSGIENIAVAGVIKKVPVGIVQLVDPFGNPLTLNEDLEIELEIIEEEIGVGFEVAPYTEEELEEEILNRVFTITDSVILKKGTSYTEFFLISSGVPGEVEIFASAEGISFGSSMTVEASEFFKALSIFPPDIADLPIGETIQSEFFVDDDDGDSVEDVRVTIVATNATVVPSSLLTDEFGSAVISVAATDSPSSLSFTAEKFGYITDTVELTFETEVIVEEQALFGVDPIILYGAIGGMVAAVAVIAIKFLRKPPPAPDEEEEEL